MPPLRRRVLSDFGNGMGLKVLKEMLLFSQYSNVDEQVKNTSRGDGKSGKLVSNSVIALNEAQV